MYFKEGMDAGVIVSQEFEYNITDKEYKSPMFALSLLEEGKQLAKSSIEIITEELK